MVPTSWRVREGGGAMALMPWCYAAGSALVRLVGWLPVGMGAVSDTAALGDRGMSVRHRSCSDRDEGGGAMALMPRCYAGESALVRLVGRLPVDGAVMSSHGHAWSGREPSPDVWATSEQFCRMVDTLFHS